MRKTPALLTLMLVWILAACGTLERPTGPLRIAADQVIRVQDPRIRANDTAKLQALADDIATRLGGNEGGQSILALSGGGANGAYGAGVIVGWTEHGDRPRFDVVTGVSTGALAAPFAFLGPDWDDELRHAYVSGGSNGILSARTFSVFSTPSLFSPRVLRTLVDANVTPELLAAIAVEHAKGRRLLVATTNLDTEETVIWDMGLLASQGSSPQGGAAALALFRDVLVASASIPGVFPPVLISGLNPDGEVVQEMHVDGGVNTPFLAIPEDLLLWTSPSASQRSSALYVIVNGQTGRNTGVTPGRIGGILARTYDSMSKSSLRMALAANAAFAARNNMSLSMTAIPDNVAASSLKFDTESMRALFELGRAQAASGRAWSTLSVSSGVEPLIATREIPQDQVPEALAPAPASSPPTPTPTPTPTP
jgi:hypothetical protein